MDNNKSDEAVAFLLKEELAFHADGPNSSIYLYCNDVFDPAADYEEINKDEAIKVMDAYGDSKNWRAVMEFVANKRGYPKDLAWFCDRIRKL